jgi:hypothetical protein
MNTYNTTEITFPIIYDGLASLSDTLMRRMNYKLVTLELTQEEYDSFVNDLDTLENIYVGKFRPTKINEDNICDWLFSGSLKIKFKIK